MPKLAVVVAAVLLFAPASPSWGQADSAPPPAVPLDPVTAVLAALQTHQIVALGESHHNLQIHEFRLELVRDPRFPAVVDDIVVEFGASQHQAIIDRYMNGHDVPQSELRRVWMETTQGGVWDGPVYEDFYAAVREVNGNLPEERRIRVILGDSGAETMDEEAALIRREVTSKGRNALIVYGYGHFLRKPMFWPVSDPEWAELIFNHPSTVSTVAHLEAAGIKVFSIYPEASDDFAAVQTDVASWPVPSLAILNRTKLGAEPYATFGSKDTLISVPNADGRGFHQENVPADPLRSGLTQEQFDAVLILGPRDSMRSSAPRAPVRSEPLIAP